jgi:phage terminase large subunit GpA-like protein
VRRKPRSRVIAVKGVASASAILNSPTKVDVKITGKRKARGCMVWPVGVNVAKDELYSWLKLDPPTTESGEPFPPGYCHHPTAEEAYFKQITAEHLVSTIDRKGFAVHEWQMIPGRENHWLDARVYARAAAQLEGLDSMRPRAPLTQAQAIRAPGEGSAAGESGCPCVGWWSQNRRHLRLQLHRDCRRLRSRGGLSDYRFLGKRGRGWLRKR